MKRTLLSHPVALLGRMLAVPLLVGTLATATTPARAAKVTPDDPPPGATPTEIEKGDKAAEEFEKSPKIKLLDPNKSAANKALLDKLNRMATELGKVSARPLIKYTVKVVDDTDMNAFTLPNGHIYMYRGLADAVASDDELAAVLAHEIGHNARMHALRAEAKAKKFTLPQIAALLALLKGGEGGANVAMFSQYLLIGVMNGYNIEYEKEADKAAVNELVKTHYNPSAMVTLMNRLDQEEKRRPDIKMGIFQTHPTSEERAAACLADIQAAGVTYSPRDVQGGQQAVGVAAPDRVAVKLGDVTLVEFAPTADAKTRADATAQQVNQLLRANLKMHEITVTEDARGARVMARGLEIARATPDDAKLQKLTPLQCATKWRDNFRRLFWSEEINGKL